MGTRVDGKGERKKERGRTERTEDGEETGKGGQERRKVEERGRGRGQKGRRGRRKWYRSTYPETRRNEGSITYLETK